MPETEGAGGAPARNRSSSLRRALGVLDFVAGFEDPAGASLSDLAQGLGLHKSTLLRLLTPLTETGLVLRDGERGRYRLGSHTAYLAGAYLERLDLRASAREVLARLAERSGHTARLSLREGEETVLVDAAEGRGPMPVRPRLGARRPLGAGAAGWAVLARLDGQEAGGPPGPAVAAARRRGFAVDDGATEPGVLHVDAAVLDHEGTPVAALGLSGPLFTPAPSGRRARPAPAAARRQPDGAALRPGTPEPGRPVADAQELGRLVAGAARDLSRALGDRSSRRPAGKTTLKDRRQAVHTDDAPQPVGAYSQAVAAGGLLYTAGLGPHDPVTRRVVGTDVAEQTRQTMRNLEAVLAAHGLGFADVVRATVHLQHLDRDFADFNAVYESFLAPPYPARTTVGADLANVLVEIDMTAVLR